MLNKHPGAQLLKTMGDPPVDIRFGTDQYVQCTAVTPEPDLSNPMFTNPDVPPKIKAFYEHWYGPCIPPLTEANSAALVPLTRSATLNLMPKPHLTALRRSGLKKRH